MDINTCLATTVDIRTLALYSHMVPALAIAILGVFTLWKASNKVKAVAFFGFTMCFALWLVVDGLAWISNPYLLVAALWAPLDYINIVFFLALFYFTWIDLSDRKVSIWLNGLVLLLAAIPFAITVAGYAVFEMDQSVCEMADNAFLANYKLGIEILVLIATLCLGVYRFIIKSDLRERIRISLITFSVVLFMGIFASVEYYSTSTGNYEVTLYSLFILPIFILILTIAITNYGTFRLGDAAVKVLFYVFLTLAGSQFFSVTNLTDFLIAAMSFGVILVMGIMLFMSNEKEIKMREQVEDLVGQLADTNKRQEGLLHFIGHEVKGFLTKDMGAFAALIEGDVGGLDAPVKTFVAQALAQTREGVKSVTDLLQASNQKTGKVTYKKEPFDLKALVAEVVEKLKPNAEKKGLSLTLNIADGEYMVVGDGEKFGDHVLRNLIDNSINYTPTGSINVSLKKDPSTSLGAGGKIIFAVQDTGVGISDEDKAKLFTEGGRGTDSIKVNVHSTGYGLFIAKNIIEAHGGTIRAESEGTGKGSTFVVELPA